MRFLSENTLVPVGLAITVIGGAAAWLTTVYFQGQANAAQLEKVSSRQDAYMTTLLEIRSDVAVIKARLEESKNGKDR